MINYHVGNLFNELPDSSEKVIIPHIVNDLGLWGSGFVIPLGNYYPKAREAYLNWAAGYMALPFEIGQTQFVLVDENKYVANMVGQKGIISKDNPRPINYNALALCMESVSAFMQLKSIKKIIAPAFGSNRAGGDWRIISRIIFETWITKDYEVHIYSLYQKDHDILMAMLGE